MSVRRPEIRCPRLGHQVTLAYCYQEGGGRPCRRLLLCWEAVMPRLRSVLARRLGPEEWQDCFGSPPPPKLVSLAECIQRARASTKDESGSQEGPSGQ